MPPPPASWDKKACVNNVKHNLISLPVDSKHLWVFNRTLFFKLYLDLFSVWTHVLPDVECWLNGCEWGSCGSGTTTNPVISLPKTPQEQKKRIKELGLDQLALQILKPASDEDELTLGASPTLVMKKSWLTGCGVSQHCIASPLCCFKVSAQRYSGCET